MLRQQLEHHWPSHLLAGVALTYAAAMVFFVTTMLGFADHTLALSVKKSIPHSDLVVYSEADTALAVAEQIGELDQVETVFVDSSLLAEVLTETEHLPVSIRSLAPPVLRTQEIIFGEFPASPREIAVTHQLASALHVQAGDELTVAGGDVAKRYSVSGIYTRSRLLDPVGFEAITTEPNPNFVAAQGNEQGGIEVRVLPTADPDTLQAEILEIPGTVVVNAQDRYDVEYARQRDALDTLTEATPWLLTTAFITATTVVYMTVVGVARRRTTESQALRSLGLSALRRHRMLGREVGVVAGLTYLLGIGVGYAGAMGASSIARAESGAPFLPASIGFPAAATFWAFVAVALATVIGTATGILSTYLRTTNAWKPAIRTASPAIVLFAAAFLYATVAMPGALSANVSAGGVVVSLLALAAATLVAYGVIVVVTRRLTKSFHVGSAFSLLPRSLTATMTTVSLFVILMSSAALGALHTTYSTLTANDDRLANLYDLSITAGVNSASISDADIQAVHDWGGASATLTYHLLNTSGWEPEDFQPGALYAVDPGEAEDYLGRRIEPGTLLVPRGTNNVPSSMNLTYVDAKGFTRSTNVNVTVADVPFALISSAGLGDLEPTAMWIRLADHHHISEDFSRLEASLTPGEDRPFLTLAITPPQEAPANVSQIAAIIQTSVIAVLGFAAYLHVPRYLADQSLETRYLRSKGMTGLRIRQRRLSQGMASAFVTSVTGVGLGVGSTLLLMTLHGRATPHEPSIPIVTLALNIGSILLGCLALGILGYHVDVSKRTKARDYAEIGR
ncbi:ABC transporter permease [Trueperella bernardiae]|uniref:ABC transporter permease n=1 Tax=Trueperella bernardiae TaxID=59561 RepID=UPI0008383296|nr:hypothetical protein [Trueperella bernardiae]OCW60818.1 hypothetical protein AKG36_04015 [Trueperella bernardiae]